MSECFIGEIRIFGGNYAPMDWAVCDGQTLTIAQNDVLYSLIGTTYGGDGQTNFKLPDLRGRIPVHMGQGPGLTPRTTGQSIGAEQVILGASDMPAHTHVAQGNSSAGTQSSPENGVWAASSLNQFSANTATAAMNTAALASAGGGQSHDNLMPYLCINFIIALSGIYPSRD
jgi:microcystin-dependent protein